VLNTSITHRESAPSASLRGHWLTGLRGLWLAVAVLTLGLFVAGIPPRFDRLLGVAAEYRPALQDLGLSAGFYAVYLTALDLAIVLTHSVIALLIFWYKSDDWMALFVSLTLVTAPLSFIKALGAVQPAGLLLANFVNYLGLVSSISLLYLFPDGRFVPRWTRPLAVLWAGLNLPAIFFPAAPLSLRVWPLALQVLLLLAWSASGVYAQIYRYVGVSSPAQRQQIKWAVLGLTAAVLGPIGYYLPYFTLPSLTQPSLPGLLYNLAGPTIFSLSLLYRLATVTTFTLGLLLFPISFAVAILRYRLWDINLLINRTLVYAALTGVVVGMYAVVVGFLGALFQARGSLLISIVATGLVAVLFQPLRHRLQRGVNRLMYGERDDPVAVLSRLGQRLQVAIAPEAALPALVETMAQALKLPYAAIALKQGDDFKIAAEYRPTPLPGFASPFPSPVLPAHERGEGGEVLPLVYHSELIGQLILAPRAPGEAFTQADRRLLENIARHAGAVAHAVRLTADLQRSRERLVTAREEERRRLRRDLHDGLGPTLASQTLKLDAALDLLSADPTAASALLLELKAQSRATVAEIRRLVYELRPPALDELGLVSALQGNAAHYAGPASGLRISVEAPPDGLPPLSAAVEVAAYRIALEALTNVARHARARQCVLRLSIANAGLGGHEGLPILQLNIADDGVGMPTGIHAGMGLTSMRERAEELGGTCIIEAGPGGGTRVLARLPLNRGA